MLSIQIKLIHRRFSAWCRKSATARDSFDWNMPTFDSTAREQIAPGPTFHNLRQGCRRAICFVGGAVGLAT
jgi:hypothetical protein